tara:strand:- start:3 stop:185 length:183 start_codon:yes stop_codon:yes gene_type:complete
MNNLNITSAQYLHDVYGQNYAINIVVDGKTLCVPPIAGNTHYDEIQAQVDAGTLTIADAD